MKSLIQRLFIASAGTLLSSSAFAAVSLDSGNLAIAFYQVQGSGGSATVQPNTYVFDLGAASIYRENTTGYASVSTINSGITSSNIGADLVAAFGSDWATSGTVSWAIVGGVTPGGAVVDGDPNRTIYLSRGRASLLDGVSGSGSSIADLSNTNVSGIANDISVFFTGTNAANQSGLNANGAIIPISSTNSFEDFLPPATSTYFNGPVNPLQVIGSGTLSGGSLGEFEGILDVYRILRYSTDADLTAGASSGNAEVGKGQYIGTFTLDGAGNLSFGAIPEPSTTLLAGLFGTFALFFRRRSA